MFSIPLSFLCVMRVICISFSLYNVLKMICVFGLNSLHKCCYNVVADEKRSDDVRQWKNTIGIREYLHEYEKCTESSLDRDDCDLVAGLCSERCVFCAFCSRSIPLQDNGDRHELTTPFWVCVFHIDLVNIVSCWCILAVCFQVLVDILSCWWFLWLYPITLLALLFLGFFEWLFKKWNWKPDYKDAASQHQNLSHLEDIDMPSGNEPGAAEGRRVGSHGMGEGMRTLQSANIFQ